jgi:hypothetical protein
VQFPIGAVLQHSNTPSLRVAGFEDEDDDEDENEAPHERHQIGFCLVALVHYFPQRIAPGATFRAHFVGTSNPGLKPHKR